MNSAIDQPPSPSPVSSVDTYNKHNLLQSSKEPDVVYYEDLDNNGIDGACYDDESPSLPSSSSAPSPPDDDDDDGVHCSPSSRSPSSPPLSQPGAVPVCLPRQCRSLELPAHETRLEQSAELSSAVPLTRQKSARARMLTRSHALCEETSPPPRMPSPPSGTATDHPPAYPDTNISTRYISHAHSSSAINSDGGDGGGGGSTAHHHHGHHSQQYHHNHHSHHHAHQHQLQHGRSVGPRRGASHEGRYSPGPPLASAAHLSRESSSEVYTDSKGVNVEQFLSGALSSNFKDQALLFKYEQYILNFIRDDSLTDFKFPPQSSYQRMLVHRAAAYFGLDHNVDQTGTQVVVTKTDKTRVPELRFRDLLRAEPDEPKRVLRRDGTGSVDSRDFDSLMAHHGSSGSGGGSWADSNSRRFLANKSHSVEQPPRYARLNNSMAASVTSSTPASAAPVAETSTCKSSTDCADRDGVPGPSSSSSRGAGHTMSKSHSFGGYTHSSVVTDGASASGQETASVQRTPSGGESGVTAASVAGGGGSGGRLSKQDSSGSSVSRLSPSSGYKTASASQATLDSTPSPTAQLHESPQSLLWAVSRLEDVPPGAVIIDPVSGQPYVNADGSLYHFDPTNPPRVPTYPPPSGELSLPAQFQPPPPPPLAPSSQQPPPPPPQQSTPVATSVASAASVQPPPPPVYSQQQTPGYMTAAAAAAVDSSQLALLSSPAYLPPQLQAPPPALPNQPHHQQQQQQQQQQLVAAAAAGYQPAVGYYTAQAAGVNGTGGRAQSVSQSQVAASAVAMDKTVSDIGHQMSGALTLTDQLASADIQQQQYHMYAYRSVNQQQQQHAISVPSAGPTGGAGAMVYCVPGGAGLPVRYMYQRLPSGASPTEQYMSVYGAVPPDPNSLAAAAAAGYFLPAAGPIQAPPHALYGATPTTPGAPGYAPMTARAPAGALVDGTTLAAAHQMVGYGGGQLPGSVAPSMAPPVSGTPRLRGPASAGGAAALLAADPSGAPLDPHQLQPLLLQSQGQAVYGRPVSSINHVRVMTPIRSPLCPPQSPMYMPGGASSCSARGAGGGVSGAMQGVGGGGRYRRNGRVRSRASGDGPAGSVSAANGGDSGCVVLEVDGALAGLRHCDLHCLLEPVTALGGRIEVHPPPSSSESTSPPPSSASLLTSQHHVTAVFMSAHDAQRALSALRSSRLRLRRASRDAASN